MRGSMLPFVALLLVAAPVSVLGSTMAFVDGFWFEGTSFEARDVYSVDGILSFAEPKSVDRTIDLDGGFVIPPFGEAHNHDLVSDWEITERINEYLWDGVFYAKMPSAFSVETKKLSGILNVPTGVDVSFAYAPVTGPGGHPIRLREVFFERGFYDDLFASKEAIEGIGYIIIRDRADLDAEVAGTNRSTARLYQVHAEPFRRVRAASR